MIIVCKKYYIDTLVKELGINNVNINNPTYIPIDDSFETIMKSHNQCITSVGLEISEEDQNLPYLYWTPKLHKSPYKHRFIAGSIKCTTKDLSCLLTKVLSTIKDGLVRYCNTKTSRNGVNNMWISQLIRYARCCSHYDDFRYRHKCLVDRLLSQGYIALRLEKSFKKFYGRYQDLIEKYQRSVNVMVNDSFPG